MTEIEKKALALLNEVLAAKGYAQWQSISYDGSTFNTALCRAIEQHEAYKQDVSDAMKLMSEKHEAFRQEVSDAVGWWNMEYLLGDDLRKEMARFIIAKTDPLVEAIREMALTDATPEDADRLRAALAARGLEVRKIGEGE